MKRKLLFVLLTVIMVVSCVIGLVACGGNEENDGNISSANGTYYLYENDSYDKSQYIIIDGDSWTDDAGDGGKVNISGESITLYVELSGESEEFASGTIKDGTLTLNIMGAEVIYRKDGSSVTDPYKPVEKTLNFKLSGDNSYYIVTGIGGLSGAITVPETYQNKPVQQIAESAFAGESSLTEIILPQSITTIGANAFSDCSNLTSAKLSEGLTVIPESVFSGCGKLTKVTIPSSVSKIEKDAFTGCDTLADIYYLGTISDWCEIEFNYYRNGNSINYSNPLYIAENLYIDNEIVTDITIDSASAIAPTAFISYDKLESVNIDISGSIGEYAFYRCENLVTLNLNSATMIGDYAFFRCSKLAELSIPDTTTEIGYAAFGYCAALQKLTTGDGVREIGDYAFENCTALQTAVLGNTVTDIGDSAFTSCQSLSELTFGNSLSAIGEMAFYTCDNLTEVTFPASLMYIGEQAFGHLTSAVFESPSGWSIGNKNNTELSEETLKNPQEAAKLLTTSILHGGYYENYWEVNTLVYTLSSDGTYYSVKNNGMKTRTNVVIPSEYKGIPVTSIEEDAFRGCTTMCSIIIPNSITKIGGYAFSNCRALTIYCEATESSSGWKNSWNDSKCPIVFDCKNNDVAENGAIYTVVGGIRYSLTDGKATVEVQPSNISGNIVIPATVTYKQKIYEVKEIAGNAFSDCNSLTSITIPSSVTTIWGKIANNCVGLTIYCEIDSEPEGWNNNWRKTDVGYGNENYHTVVWNCRNNEIASNGYIYTIINGVRYALKEDKATVTVQFRNISGNIQIPSNITYKGKIYNVESISARAFLKCKGLKSITLPEGIVTIGQWAFRQSGIKSITIPSTVTSIDELAFCECGGLSSIAFAEGSRLTSIEGRAFSYCRGLTSITIPKNVTTIGDYAFLNCNNLEEIYYQGNIAGWCKIDDVGWLMGYGRKLYIDGKELIGELVIPNGVTSIPSGAFIDCTSLTSVTIPDSVTSIGSSAFSGCTSLTGITIPDSVTSIGSSAFSDCSSLTSIIIPDSVTNIGEGAFRYCSSLTSITIPDSVTSIGSSAFSGCISLMGITIPDSVTSIGKNAFYGCEGLTIYCVAESKPSGWNSYWNCIKNNYGVRDYCPVVWNCENSEVANNGYIYTIVNGLRYALKDNKAMVARQSITISGDIQIPQTITYKGETYNVESIDNKAFSNCSGLTSIIIPKSVISIGKNAFTDCSSLTSVIFENADGWYVTKDSTATSGTSISSSSLTNPSTAANYLRATYDNYYWKRG